jgi:hypothetical protein
MKGATRLLANHIDRLSALVIDLGHHVLNRTGVPVRDRENNGLGGSVGGHLLGFEEITVLSTVYSLNQFYKTIRCVTCFLTEFLIVFDDAAQTQTQTQTQKHLKFIEQV